MIRRHSVGLAIGGVALVVLAVVAWGLASADDEPSRGEDRGDAAQIVVETPGSLPLDDIRDATPVPTQSGAGSAPSAGATPGGSVVSPSAPPVGGNTGSPPSIAVGEPTPPSGTGRPGQVEPRPPVERPIPTSPDGTPLPLPGNPGGPSLPPTTPSAPGKTAIGPDREYVRAPIDGLEVVALESSPVQFLLRVQAGLPSGCALAAGYEISRAGEVIRVDVWNSLPKGAAICTQIYGMYSVGVPLASGFDAGKTYRVIVNDAEVSFVGR